MNRPEANGAEDSAAKWQLVERIAASRHFARASHVRDFLLFVSRRVLLEGREEVTETEIACNVMGRPADFDPREDNIVRVQVRQLRSRLEEYFAKEGRDEPIIVQIPKGTYLPRFEPRTPEAQTAEPGKAWPWKSIAIAAVAVCILLGLALVAWLRKDRLRSASEVLGEPANPLLGRVLRNRETTTILVADYGMTMAQDAVRAQLSLERYLAPNLRERLLEMAEEESSRKLLGRMYDSDATSLADTVAAARFSRASVFYGAHVAVRSCRNVELRGLKDGNFILVGGPRANPLISVFDEMLNFHLVIDLKSPMYFQNRSPLPGEDPRYPAVNVLGPAATYAVVALVPGPGGNGNALLMSGMSMNATESASEFVERGRLAPALSNWLQQDGHYCELLLRTRGLRGQTWTTDVVAARRFEGSGTTLRRLPPL